MSSFLLLHLELLIPFGDVALVIFLLIGLMVRAFGFMMNEVMERRFRQSSRLTSSARIFSISERFIFLNFVEKDTYSYILLWVLPFIAEFTLAIALFLCLLLWTGSDRLPDRTLAKYPLLRYQGPRLIPPSTRPPGLSPHRPHVHEPLVRGGVGAPPRAWPVACAAEL